ncbi:pyruvate carboxylase [Saitozyma sp. JCM 24511]|nr:pyruvate carboxylase [Saitozyma sp. JCM 24511]
MIPTPPDSRLGNMLSLHPVHDNPRPLTPHTHQQIEAWASHLGVDQSTPGTPSSPGTPIHSIQGLRKKQAGTSGPLKKVLVANRGEIAIRVFRTAHELAMSTVAIYSFEDRMNAHRYKSDESYLVGKGLTPVAAYLAQDDIVRIALEHGVDMIHPGYGFLSENAEFAGKVEAAGIAFIGPRPETIDALGDKTKARTLAMKTGVPVVPGTPGPVENYEAGKAFIEEYGFPVIIKAAMGGGGRGMRVVRDQASFKESFERAVSEAKSAFGDGTVFIERFLEQPRHIEVQLLADAEGNCVHLFERDCSVQRRHQKVVEVAPAPHLDESVRQAILSDALKLAHAVKYRNAGTAEFLVDKQNRHYFIEINPRIQVEHTITEEITGIDIVAAQIQIAAGVTLEQLGLTQEHIHRRGFAIQCRITTEDAAAGFQPDTGKIEVYRSAGGNGVRLDASSGYAGAQITPHYDSLLVKCSVSGATYEVARRKMLRALVEFRIRGVKTNIPFLIRLLTHPVFESGKTWTTFIDDTPELFKLVQSQNRAQKLLAYLGDVAVNGSSIKGQMGEPGLKTEALVPQIRDKADSTKLVDTSVSCQTGWRNIIVNEGPEAFAKAIRNYKGCLIMDTTWRDAHQSLLATRMRTVDMANIAKETSWALQNAYSLECWGGATFDVAMRFLYEDPWDRLRTLRKLVPNIPLQALVRGANAVGYTSYPDNAIYEFSKKAVEAGLDIFRVFDSLNYFDNLKLGIDAAKKAGGVVEGTICYSGDVANPKKTKYTLDYYLDLTDKLVKEGIHVLGIKDMAGLLKPEAARLLIGAIRKAHPDLPIHVHSHDTAGIAAASMIAAAQAGADVVDVAIDDLSGLTSQPAMGAVVAALEQTGLGTGISHENIQALNSYWSQIRVLYKCFEANVRASDSGVFDHEMPGGQYTNLQFQASQLGLGTQWLEVKKKYIEANQLCGDIIKVTPSSKVVGDFAQFMVSNNLSKQDVIDRASQLDFPSSVVEFFQGYLGQPYGGFPEPLRSSIIRDKERIDARPGLGMKPLDFKKIKHELREKYGNHITDFDVQSYCMYPKVFEEFQGFVEKYGDLSVVPTRYFLSKPDIGEELSISIEQGKTLTIKLLAVGPLNTDKGTRECFFELNGETRAVVITDRNAAIEHVSREKATSDPGSVGSPMSGVVIDVRVKEGAEVKAGDPLCVLSAMKMESVVSSPVSGKVKRVLVNENDSIAQGDLVVEITH